MEGTSASKCWLVPVGLTAAEVSSPLAELRRVAAAMHTSRVATPITPGFSAGDVRFRLRDAVSEARLNVTVAESVTGSGRPCGAEALCGGAVAP